MPVFCGLRGDPLGSAQASGGVDRCYLGGHGDRRSGPPFGAERHRTV